MSLERQEGKGPRARGAVRAARVLRLYKDAAGRPVCDVTDFYGGTYNGLRFAVGGGGSDAFDYDPPKAPDVGLVEPEVGTGSEVLIAFPDGYTTLPWIVGGLPHPDLAARVKSLPRPAATADYPVSPTDVGLTDRVIEHHGVRVTLSQKGGVVIDSRTAALPVRVQLAEGQALRVSMAGEAQEHLVLAGPLKAFLDALVARVNQIGMLAHQLERWAQQLPTGAIEVDGVPKPVQTIDRYTGVEAQRTAAMLAASASGSPVAAEAAASIAAGLIFDTPFGGPGDIIVAKAIQVSRRSLADG